jgi:hypothetical protein
MTVAAGKLLETQKQKGCQLEDIRSTLQQQGTPGISTAVRKLGTAWTTTAQKTARKSGDAKSSRDSRICGNTSSRREVKNNVRQQQQRPQQQLDLMNVNS